MNDQKKNYNFRLNIIDVILIAIILSGIALVVYMFNSDGFFSKSNAVEIIYTIEIKQVNEEFKGENFIKEGDSVTDTVTLYSIGEVTEVSYADCLYTGIDSEGNLVESKYPNHMNVTLTIKATADISDGIYSVDGYTIAVGKEMAIRVPNFVGEGYCTSIIESAA